MKFILYLICVIILLSTTGCIFPRGGETMEIREAEVIRIMTTITVETMTTIMVETIATMVDTTTTIIDPKHQGLSALWSCDTPMILDRMHRLFTIETSGFIDILQPSYEHWLSAILSLVADNSFIEFGLTS